MIDKVHQRTDKKLYQIERKMNRIYRNDSDLISVRKEYTKYMSMVQTRTDDLYRAFINETDKDIKSEAKKAYMDAVERLTIKSKEYNKLIKKIVSVLAKVNQEALDVVNDSMSDIYVMNYNQVATECKRVGIKVND